jgi:hypothetical protein
MTSMGAVKPSGVASRPSVNYVTPECSSRFRHSVRQRRQLETGLLPAQTAHLGTRRDLLDIVAMATVDAAAVVGLPGRDGIAVSAPAWSPKPRGPTDHRHFGR